MLAHQANRIADSRNARGTLGFSLVQLSIFLTIIALAAAATLPGGKGPSLKALGTVQKLETIEKARRGFMAAYGRLPCPASGTQGVGEANFGVEAATPGTCNGGAPAADMLPGAAPNDNIVGGVVPVRTLGLPDDYAFDEYGRMITYVADRRATSCTACKALAGGSIEIQDTAGTVLENVMAVYISHGPDGHGAFPAQGSAVAGRRNAYSTDADTQDNASVDGAFAVSFDRIFVKKDRTSAFDDIVYYAPETKNECALKASFACAGDPPLEGFRVDGAGVNDHTGDGVTTGDVNGDGIRDLLISSRRRDGANLGSVYVVFGKASGWTSPIVANTLDGNNGFRIDHNYGQHYFGHGSGTALSAADVNGDAYDDVIIGAPVSGAAAEGLVYVIYGGPSPSTMGAVFDVANIDGINGYILQANDDDDGTQLALYPSLGYAIATADVDGDGAADMLISAASGDGPAGVDSGVSYLVMGNSACINGSATYLLDATFADGTCAVRFDGADVGGYSGLGVDISDVTGDGIQDILIGGATVDIVAGVGGPWPWGAPWAATIDLSTAIRISSVTNGVDARGDINGDGINDITIGGVDFVIFGSAGLASMDLGVMPLDGTNGFYVTNASNNLETDVTFGDINNDTFPDFLTAGGAVIFGSNPWPPAVNTVDGNALTGADGFKMTDSSGLSVASGTTTVADINNDGVPDAIVADHNADHNGTNTGSTFVLFGGAGPPWGATYDLGGL